MPKPIPLNSILDDWLASCTRNKKISRNTIAMGIVILDRLRLKCPLDRSDIVSSGGEISGSRGGLYKILSKYDIPEKYLKEVTTRQAHQDGQRFLEALQYGAIFGGLKEKNLDEVLFEGIQRLRVSAQEWLKKKQLSIPCDRQDSPAAWVHAILNEAKGKSGGKVEQHLVGAKLERRHPNIPIANHPGHAADAPTSRDGDFRVGDTCYHVTATPSLPLIKKAALNLESGLHPLLLVPRDQVQRAIHLAEGQEIEERITVIAIEDFLALNIIEMSEGQQQSFVNTLKSIVEIYNRRLEEVETDMSLKIELR
jgi:hypothetical protein